MPATNNVIHDAVGFSQEQLSATKREFIQSIGKNDMGSIKRGQLPVESVICVVAERRSELLLVVLCLGRGICKTFAEGVICLQINAVAFPMHDFQLQPVPGSLTVIAYNIDIFELRVIPEECCGQPDIRQIAAYNATYCGCIQIVCNSGRLA